MLTFTWVVLKQRDWSWLKYVGFSVCCTALPLWYPQVMKGTLRRSCRFSNWPGPSELSVTLNPRNENLEKQIGSTSLVPNQQHSHRLRPLKTWVEDLNHPSFSFLLLSVFPLLSVCVPPFQNNWMIGRVIDYWLKSLLVCPSIFFSWQSDWVNDVRVCVRFPLFLR